MYFIVKLQVKFKVNQQNKDKSMKTRTKRESITTIGIRVTASELAQIELIKKKRRISSYSHTMRVLIAEEAEKLSLASKLDGVVH